MKNNSIFINRLISSIFILIFLIYIFINNLNNSTKFIIIPFLFCSIFSIGKNICIIINKKKYIKLLSKLYIISFLIFLFGFLLFWCYYNFITKNYSFLLISLPFWLIGIFIINRFLLKRKNKLSKFESKINFKIIISASLVLICLLSGVIMLFFGIKDTYILKQKTKNYITINGYFKDYDIYDTTKDGTTYKLTYVYIVDDKEYAITSNYGTNYIPEKNSIRPIKYNPSNPSEAIIEGTNNNNILIFMGAFFTFGSLTFILGALSVLGYFNKLKFDIVGIYIGFLFLSLGIGFIFIQNKTTFSLIKTIKSFGLWILIPVMFIVVGIIQIIKCIRFSKNKFNKKNK